jgi:hypothetical protein
MAKRGKTPSLIGGGAGACKLVTAKHKRTCKRCKGAILGGCGCIEVKIPSTMGYKCYCTDCFKEILGQTQHDLDSLVEQVSIL